MKQIGGASSDLSIKLIKELYKPGDNLIFSPASIQLALGMLLGGSAGESNSELKKAVFSGLRESVVHDELSQLAQALNAPNDNYQLYTANRLYTDNRFSVREEYVALLAKSYGSSFKQVDFEGNAEAVRQEINKWVEEVTKTRIKDLLPEGVIDGLTRSVIVNAIYFKGSWAKKFNPRLTKTKDFHTSPSSKLPVQMMHQNGEEMPYFEDDISRAVLLPYKGNTLGMLFILPKERHGLAKVVQAAHGDWFRKVGSQLRSSRRVNLQIPRFKIEFCMSMQDTLTKLGMVRLWQPSTADLSRITGETGLYVSAVIHKAFLEVNEEGSEAAAATAVVKKKYSKVRKPPPIEMTVDQPFLLAIWDRDHDLPLFAGLVTHLKE